MATQTDSDGQEKRRQQREAEAAQERRRQRENRWQWLCPPLYRETDPARLPPVPLAEVMAWQYGPQGLLLIGPTGAGKTRAAYLLLRRLLDEDESRRIIAFGCLDFGHEAARRFREATGETWVAGVARADVVFFDDFGKEPLTERVEAELFGLIEYRTAHHLPILATSNLTGAALEAKASADRGGPMVRRLREFCRVAVFTVAPDPAGKKDVDAGGGSRYK
jgi:DNA polymerase III delta prime subunit